MASTTELVEELHSVILANPGKHFTWDTSRLGEARPIELVMSVGYQEWLGWSDEERFIFVLGLQRIAHSKE